MTRLDPAGEPSMEEILASIRRIIAEDPPGSRPQDPPAVSGRKASRSANGEQPAAPRQPEPSSRPASTAEMDIAAQLGAIAPGARLNDFSAREAENPDDPPADAQDSVQAALDSLRLGQPPVTQAAPTSPAAVAPRSRDPFDFTLPGARLEPQPAARASSQNDPFEFSLGPSPFARNTPAQPAAPQSSPQAAPALEALRAASADRLGGFVPTRIDPFSSDPVHPGGALPGEGSTPMRSMSAQPKSESFGAPGAMAPVPADPPGQDNWPLAPEPAFASVEIVQRDVPAPAATSRTQDPATPAPATFQMEPPANSRPVFGGPVLGELATAVPPPASSPAPAAFLPEMLAAQPSVARDPFTMPQPVAPAAVSPAAAPEQSPAFVATPAPHAAAAATPVSAPPTAQVQSAPAAPADFTALVVPPPAGAAETVSSPMTSDAASAAAAVLEQIARPGPAALASSDPILEPASSQPQPAAPAAAQSAGAEPAEVTIVPEAVQREADPVPAAVEDKAAISEPVAHLTSKPDAAYGAAGENQTSEIELHEAFVEDLDDAGPAAAAPPAHAMAGGRGALTMRTPHADHEIDAPRTMEDTVADLLRPMLKNWLAENMPRIVERALRKELEASNRSEHKTAAE